MSTAFLRNEEETKEAKEQTMRRKEAKETDYDEEGGEGTDCELAGMVNNIQCVQSATQLVLPEN